MAPYITDRQLAVMGSTETLSRSLRRATRIALFVGFTALGAQLAVRLPWSPVPVTLQTLFVMLAGVTLGARDGCWAMICYLALGLAGAPVFAGFAWGPAALIGPTGGYLAAFPLAALVTGHLSSRLGGGRGGIFIASAAGTSLILGAGALHLGMLLDLGPAAAVAAGAAPFLGAEIVKASIAAAVSR